MIYFTNTVPNHYNCNVCQVTVEDEGDMQSLTTHMQAFHKDICELHKTNTNENVGFRIEFLQQEAASSAGVTLRLEPDHADYTKHPSTKEILAEETITEETIIGDILGEAAKTPATPASKRKMKDNDNRRRSWVWKYFDKLSSIIFKCNICNVVLSIKGCNTNNMNRHVKSKHPALYHAEMENTLKKKVVQEPMTDVGCEVEIPEGMEDSLVIRQLTDLDKMQSRSRTSWVWNYFTPLSKTHAQCKVCRRNINHGGNATGNMNRHLKKLHEDIYSHNLPADAASVQDASDTLWIWKLFSAEDQKFYECRLCGFKCMKFADHKKSITIILEHLRIQHEVISGDQIVTATECEQELEECNVAVDFLKDSEEI